MNTRDYTLLGILDQLLLQAERPTHISELAHRLDIGVHDIREGLMRLEAKGLLDASRLRLTLSGLAAASALAGARRKNHARSAA